jgi:Raf kinase inhibitor-like YbhB/YbcL family protein
MVFTLRSPAFANGQPMPDRHLAHGQNLSPPLHWSDPPAGTRSFVLVVEDPNATQVVHLWGVHGLGSDQRALPEGLGSRHEGVRQATNDHGHRTYDGPRIPPDPGVYHYHFILAALDNPDLGIGEGATVAEVWKAATPHVIERAELVGLVKRD